ncbi:DNA-binding SARP family transcriptional activator/TolB-like protein/Tfp pilus assembly protein PilF [Rhizobium sp. BK176]|nr:DNA-binding SARP family transcriptional activator/TolB-like protein/Tfp pilus assembly protein PilF [Rhizobium sp. BK399]MCS3741722.1 DNA-binding SARP family transcriptional activator/TolB-like protein/Tfp pilus assembly protein PilF [Rhizobium sp. BK661]MCS4093550.1 DNA-binding SARP family transcriptional activator/TolB-like protein/Tfp pilus assembly protein PilF [Rhizobium sp. BK176]
MKVGMTFFLRTFGRLQLLDRNGDTVVFPEKGLLLFVYLLTSDQGQADRPAIARFLWGDADDDVARTTLRKAVSRIMARQNELGTVILSSENGLLSINRQALCSDLLLEAGGAEREPVAFLQDLLKILSQPFLGTSQSASQEFRRWFAERENYHACLLKETLRDASKLPKGKEAPDILRRAATTLSWLDPHNPETKRFILQILNAEEYVASLRKDVERRQISLSLKSSRLRSDGDVLTSSTQPAGPSDDVTSASEDVVAAVPRLMLLPPRSQSVQSTAWQLAGSLIEDITIGFCAFDSVQVIAPYSAAQVGKDARTQSDFCARHRVNYVLDTSTSGDTDDATLFVQLIYFDQHQVIWAERFSLHHMALAKDRRAVTRQVALSVCREIERYESLRDNLSPVAYHRYLVGRRHLVRLTLPNLRRARAEMKAALNVSPNFAPALSSMARTYSKEWLLTARGDIELLNTAETLAKQAGRTRSDFADAYRELGVARLLKGQFDESAEAMELAETCGPHYADVIADYADTLVHCSLPAMALQKIERAIELNPLSPDTYLWTAAGASYALADFNRALDYIGQMADPTLADRLSAASWAMLDNQEKARLHVRRFREANPDFDVDRWLSAVPSKEQWHKDLYREGLKKAGF